MKTVCYKIEFRKYGSFYDDGFFIIEFENNQILRMEGLLTFDYIEAEIVDNKDVEFLIYSLDEERVFMEPRFKFCVDANDFEIPIDFEIKNDDDIYNFSILEKRSNTKQLSEFLEKFKCDHVFKESPN